MSDARPISAAQLQQRSAAALRHGAHAAGRNAHIEQRWRRLRKRLNRSGIGVRDLPTAAWLNLRILVRYLVLIEQVELWLETQGDIFADPKSGALHPVLDRYTGWLSSAAAIVARLPAEVVVVAADDLAALAAHPARGGRM
jgi:hypothetical protein